MILYICILLLVVPVTVFILLTTNRLLTDINLTLAILLCLLPFHTLLFQILNTETSIPAFLSLLLQSWKEVLLALLVMWVLITQVLTKTKLRTPYASVVFLLGLFFLTGIIGIFRSPSLLKGLYGFRGTLEPLLFLLVVLCIPLSSRWLHSITYLLIVVGNIVAGFAIFQSLYLGFEFVYRYYSNDGVLPTSFSFMGGRIQRAMGTFSSPNQLSLYAVFIILIIINHLMRTNRTEKRWYLLISSVLPIGAIILSVSRSGWVALLAGITFSFIIWRRKGRFLIALILLLSVALTLLFGYNLDQHIINTFQGNEVSANYRTGLMFQNIETILHNPLGVGLGVVGARSQRFGQNTEVYPTESYLLQLGMELGILGLLVFIALSWRISLILYRNIFRVRNRFLRAWGVISISCLIAALVHALFIPDLQDLTVASYLWFIVGIGIQLPMIEARMHKHILFEEINGKRQPY